MPAWFSVPGLSRRRSAKFVLASLAAIIVIPLVAFTARGRWANLRFTATPGSTVARPANTTLPPQLRAASSARSRLHSKLSLQPEADRFRRRLGKRFLVPGLEVATLVGTLKLGAQQYSALITRSQAEDGESLTVGLNGGPAMLTWNGKDGAKLGNNPATGETLALLERIALDSPDQFIQAQLRGASYYFVAHNARPSEAGGADSYVGPTWKIVRVSEPANLTLAKPQSLWRLYYINTVTGLIDKVLSQERGATITAEFSGWTSRGGEQAPTRITWTRDKQIIMELSHNNISHGPKR